MKTLEELVIEKLLEKGPGGVTIFDFNDERITEESLEAVINNLQNGMYESADDHLLKFDS
jgi:hypothetical protein